jgi:hypothetical protein
MHGIGEVVVFLAFVTTCSAAFAAHRLGRPRSYPVLVLIALWPIIGLLFIERGEIIGDSASLSLPQSRGPYIILGLVIVATLLGAASSALWSVWKSRTKVR